LDEWLYYSSNWKNFHACLRLWDKLSRIIVKHVLAKIQL
jgi:hypothetical protein